MRRGISIISFLILVLGGGLLIGATNRPGAWYQGLAKPPLNPPDWLFAPAWTVLYIIIAFVGWRCWNSKPTGRLMQLWWVQLVLNFLWMPTFFGLQQMELALAVILFLLATITGFIALAWQSDRRAALLFIPYLLWSAFAAYLNIGLILLN